MNFYTHDNGARPFKVEIEKDCKIANIYKIKRKENEYKYLTTIPFERLIIGKDTSNSKQHGASILLEVAKNRYVHIGINIIDFKTPSKVLYLNSYVGNSDVVYPAAVCKDRVFLILEDVYYIQDINFIDNKYLYSAYYKNKVDAFEFKYDIIQTRLF